MSPSNEELARRVETVTLDLAVVKSDVGRLREDVGMVVSELKGVRRSLYTFSFSIALLAIAALVNVAIR